MKFNKIELKQRYKYINVYEAEYTNEENNTKIYELISRDPNLTNEKFGKKTKPDAVGMMLFNETKDKILLEKEFRMACNEEIFNLPAGLIDEGESVEEAAKRELKEETGLELYEVEKTLAPAYMATGYCDELVATVIGKARGNFTKSSDANEEITANWYSKEDVKKLFEENRRMTVRTQNLLYMWINY